VQHHWIYLDHDQRLTGSFGTAYRGNEGRAATRIYVDSLYGNGVGVNAAQYGMRRGFFGSLSYRF